VDSVGAGAAGGALVGSASGFLIVSGDLAAGAEGAAFAGGFFAGVVDLGVGAAGRALVVFAGGFFVVSRDLAVGTVGAPDFVVAFLGAFCVLLASSSLTCC
jgi:hypothetical protein